MNPASFECGTRHKFLSSHTVKITSLVLAGIVLTAVFYWALSAWTATRVGDGSEYYALERTVSLSHRPYMTDEGWAGYQQLIDSKEIASLRPAEDLQRIYAGLRLPNGTDFNHFWLYPAAAAFIGNTGSILGFEPKSHARFMLLHSILISGLLLLCLRLHGRSGFVAAAIIIVLSPVLWFTNKVHTELFTVTLTTAAIACAMKRHWAASGLLLTLASTQNISFAIPALLSCLFALWSFWTVPRSGQKATFEVLALSIATIIVLLHPSYYFFRFGTVTPQLITTGAKTADISPLSSFQYLLDPDVGLLPNWPLGAVILFAAIVITVLWRKRPDYLFISFVVIYVAATMLAQAATTNINSGATVGLSRYGLWYLCLFYPCIIVMTRVPGKYRGWPVIVMILALIPLVTANTRLHWPNRPESYTTPTPASSRIYTYAPWAWDPAVEVFSERNAQIGETIPTGRAIVMGPNCIKALYIPGPDSNLSVYPKGACGIAEQNFEQLLMSRFRVAPEKPSYFSVKPEDLARLAPVLNAGTMIGPDAIRQFLSSGWSGDEPWGVWSEGAHSTLRFRATSDIPSGSSLRILATGFWAGDHQRLKITSHVNGSDELEFTFSADQAQPLSINLPLPELKSDDPVTIDLYYEEPVSPAELGISPDRRKLAIGIVELELKFPR